MTQGYIYVLSNPLTQDVYKIGRTTVSPFVRATQLSGTSAALPFKVEMFIKHPDAAFVETVLHRALADQRVNDKREHFYVPNNIDGHIDFAQLVLMLRDFPEREDFHASPAMARLAAIGAALYSKESEFFPWKPEIKRAYFQRLG